MKSIGSERSRKQVRVFWTDEQGYRVDARLYPRTQTGYASADRLIEKLEAQGYEYVQELEDRGPAPNVVDKPF